MSSNLKKRKSGLPTKVMVKVLSVLPNFDKRRAHRVCTKWRHSMASKMETMRKLMFPLSEEHILTRNELLSTYQNFYVNANEDSSTNTSRASCSARRSCGSRRTTNKIFTRSSQQPPRSSHYYYSPRKEGSCLPKYLPMSSKYSSPALSESGRPRRISESSLPMTLHYSPLTFSPKRKSSSSPDYYDNPQRRRSSYHSDRANDSLGHFAVDGSNRTIVVKKSSSPAATLPENDDGVKPSESPSDILVIGKESEEDGRDSRKNPVVVVAVETRAPNPLPAAGAARAVFVPPNAVTKSHSHISHFPDDGNEAHYLRKRLEEIAQSRHDHSSGYQGAHQQQQEQPPHFPRAPSVYDQDLSYHQINQIVRSPSRTNNYDSNPRGQYNNYYYYPRETYSPPRGTGRYPTPDNQQQHHHHSQRHNRESSSPPASSHHYRAHEHHSNSHSTKHHESSAKSNNNHSERSGHSAHTSKRAKNGSGGGGMTTHHLHHHITKPGLKQSQIDNFLKYGDKDEQSSSKDEESLRPSVKVHHVKTSKEQYSRMGNKSKKVVVTKKKTSSGRRRKH